MGSLVGRLFRQYSSAISHEVLLAPGSPGHLPGVCGVTLGARAQQLGLAVCSPRLAAFPTSLGR